MSGSTVELQSLAGGTSGGHLGTRELRLYAPVAAARDTKAGRQQCFRNSIQTVSDVCQLPDMVCPQRDLQLPQDFGRFLHPPAKLLQKIAHASLCKYSSATLLRMLLQQRNLWPTLPTMQHSHNLYFSRSEFETLRQCF